MTSLMIRACYVGRNLRALCEQAGMTDAEMRTELGMSAADIAHMVAGRRLPPVETLIRALDFHGLAPDRRTELVELLYGPPRKEWAEHPDTERPSMWQALVIFEAEVRQVLSYQPLVLPDLLQTPAYCQALIDEVHRAAGAGRDTAVGNGGGPAGRQAAAVASRPEPPARVTARIERQAMLGRPGAPRFLFVIDEAALRRTVGSADIMREQADTLVRKAGLPGVELRLVPFGAGGHAGLAGPFVIMEFADGPDLVYLENRDTRALLHSAKALADYRSALRDILDIALDAPATVGFLRAFTAR